MHLQEASERFHLDMKLLQAYVQNGLIHGEDCEDGTIDYPETEFHRAAQFCLLEKAGMDQEMMKQFAALLDSGRKSEPEKIRLLRKCRYGLLDEIHSKQQLLDQLDYLISEIQKTKEESPYEKSNRNHSGNGARFFVGGVPKPRRRERPGGQRPLDIGKHTGKHTGY